MVYEPGGIDFGVVVNGYTKEKKRVRLRGYITVKRRGARNVPTPHSVSHRNPVSGWGTRRLGRFWRLRTGSCGMDCEFRNIPNDSGTSVVMDWGDRVDDEVPKLRSKAVQR